MNIAPLERVYFIFHALYFFRAWKKWIKSADAYSVNDNFISANAFDCIELNAYGLLHLIVKYRESNEQQLFLPGLFNSQGCESTTRLCQTERSNNIYNEVGRISQLSH